MKALNSNIKTLSSILLLAILLFQSCIGDDVIMDEVDPVIRITNPIDSLGLNSSYQFEFMYLNNVGQEETVNPEWTNSDNTVATIDQNGLLQPITIGTTDISINYDNGSNIVSTLQKIYVRDTTTIPEMMMERSGTVTTTSSYQLEGDFTLAVNDDGDLILSFADNYEASTALPGLFIYLTNNPNTSSNAFEIAAVSTFSGAHTYNLGAMGLFDYSHVLYFCKPFNVKVGDGEIE